MSETFRFVADETAGKTAENYVGFSANDFKVLAEGLLEIKLLREKYPSTLDSLSPEALDELHGRCVKAAEILAMFTKED